MSHFPGTDRYSNPELAWDKRVLEKLAAGNLKSLIGYDETELDDTGNIELRCWACAAGASASASPTSSRWIRAGITIMRRWPGSAAAQNSTRGALPLDQAGTG